MSSKPRVLLLGSGFASLETAFLLRMRAHDAVDLTLVSDSDVFKFRPNLIYVPFGADPARFLVDLQWPLHRRDIAFEQGLAREVDPDAKRVSLVDGRTLTYDKLVIGTGAGMRPEEVPGLAEHAATIWSADSMLDLRGRLERLHADALRGRRSRVLFLVPPNNKCSGPLYEVAFMLETWLRRRHVREQVDIAWSTYEHTYIQAFGPRLHDLVSGEYASRGIDGHTDEVVTEVRDGQVAYESGVTRDFDLLVAFPPYVAAVEYPGLPADDRGFLRTELETRRLTGHPDVYVPGDAGDFPVKQAFLAFLQGDAVAGHIATEVTGHAHEAPFDPVSMCIMEMFDKATFAQVPLSLTGDPDHPVAVREGAGDDYKVGTSPLWRLGKKMLGFAVPMRFSTGEPFHAGLGWQSMDVGVKAMAGMLAD